MYRVEQVYEAVDGAVETLKKVQIHRDVVIIIVGLAYETIAPYNRFSLGLHNTGRSLRPIAR
jgi:hypothetical protein